MQGSRARSRSIETIPRQEQDESCRIQSPTKPSVPDRRLKNLSLKVQGLNSAVLPALEPLSERANIKCICICVTPQFALLIKTSTSSKRRSESPQWRGLCSPSLRSRLPCLQAQAVGKTQLHSTAHHHTAPESSAGLLLGSSRMLGLEYRLSKRARSKAASFVGNDVSRQLLPFLPMISSPGLRWSFDL